MSDVVLRPMTWGDLTLLTDWLQQPHVTQWWRGEPDDQAGVDAKYGPCIAREDATELFVIVVDDRSVGMIQRYRFDDEPGWGGIVGQVHDVSDAVGIDYLIGVTEAIGRGIGTAAITAMVASTWSWRSIQQIVVSVQQANPPSWRTLEKAGFQRVWAGEFDTDDPSDQGPEYLYVLRRP